MTETESEAQTNADAEEGTNEPSKNGAEDTHEKEAEVAEVKELTLQDKIVNQVEYYFGDVNLPHDKFIKMESANNDGWFPASLLLKFNKLAGLVSSVPDDGKLKEILSAIQSSVLVEVSEDNNKVRRNPEIPLPEGNSALRTIYLKGFHKTETKLDDLLDYFKKYDGMAAVIMRYYKEKILAPLVRVAPITDEGKVKGENAEDATESKGDTTETKEGTTETKEGTTESKEEPTETKVEPPKIIPCLDNPNVVWVKKFKGSIYVVFKTEEQAKAALDDITTYNGNPLIKMPQLEHTSLKKKQYLERLESRMTQKRKIEENTAKQAEEEEKAEIQSLKGVLVKLSDVPDGTTREVIKEKWYSLTGDAEKFEVAFVDFKKGDTEGVMRLSNNGAATEAFTLETVKDGALTLNEGVTIKLGLFTNDEEEKSYITKMFKDRADFNRTKATKRGGSNRGRGRGGKRGRRR